jgi:hypothetical protein
MNSLVVFAAACLTAQVNDPQAAQAATAAQVAQPAANALQHSYLFPRLHNLLHPQPCRSPSCATRPPVAPTQVAAKPAAVAAKPAAVAAKPAAPPVATIPVPTAIQQRYLERVGHEDDYSWVTGQLYRINADGERWVVRYATADTEDRYHGNILLPPDVNMMNYRAGDLVSVHGEVINGGLPSRIGEAPFYKVNSIDIIERVD